MWYGKWTDSKTVLRAIFLRFRILKKIGKLKVVRRAHEATTRVEGAPYPLGAPPCLVGTSCALRTPFSCTILLLVGKNSLYNLPKVLTTVPRQYPLFLFWAVFCRRFGARCHLRSPTKRAMYPTSLLTQTPMGRHLLVVELQMMMTRLILGGKYASQLQYEKA